MLEYQIKENDLIESAKEQIESEKKSKKQSKKKLKKCMIESDDEQENEIVENNQNVIEEESESENEENDNSESDDEEEISLEVFTCNQPGEYQGIDLLIERKTNKIYEGDENGVTEIGKIEDGIITFNIDLNDENEE